MATPMAVFNHIAARYGVDPNDDDAVDAFFASLESHVDPQAMCGIFEELLAADGVNVEDGPEAPSSADPAADLPSLLSLFGSPDVAREVERFFETGAAGTA